MTSVSKSTGLNSAALMGAAIVNKMKVIRMAASGARYSLSSTNSFAHF
jgi:hypothetical protein